MRARALVLAAAATVLLGGCTTTVAGSASPATAVEQRAGADTPSERELIEAAADAVVRAGSMRMQGGMGMDGAPMQMDMRFRAGDVAGSLGIEGQTMEIVVTGGDFFMRAGADVWMANGVPRAMLPMVADRWVLAPPEVAAYMGTDLELSGFADGLRIPSAAGGVSIVATELDGRPVWELEAADGALLYIAAEGEPYPLRTSQTGPEGGEMRFSEFGTVAPILPPADYVDLGDLGY